VRSGLPAPAPPRALARLLELTGPLEQLEGRLRRAGASTEPVTFRIRQFSAAVVTLLAASATALALGPPVPIALLMVFGAPLVVVLAAEHDLERRISRRRAALVDALPVTIEQLGLLVGAGYSLSAALTRLAERSTGLTADSLGAVVRRIRQGRSEVDALRGWASDSQLPQVERLVAVLALHREATDLASLLAEEAAAVRSEAHRALIETIERRGQLVWVPVTVATLVPGLILLAVPFLSAVAMVTGT
jgi:Flp pilus assembly protein TadB